MKDKVWWSVGVDIWGDPYLFANHLDPETFQQGDCVSASELQKVADRLNAEQGFL